MRPGLPPNFGRSGASQPTKRGQISTAKRTNQGDVADRIAEMEAAIDNKANASRVGGVSTRIDALERDIAQIKAAIGLDD